MHPLFPLQLCAWPLPCFYPFISFNTFLNPYPISSNILDFEDDWKTQYTGPGSEDLLNWDQILMWTIGIHGRERLLCSEEIRTYFEEKLSRILSFEKDLDRERSFLASVSFRVNEEMDFLVQGSCWGVTGGCLGWNSSVRPQRALKTRRKKITLTFIDDIMWQTLFGEFHIVWWSCHND